MFTKDEVARRPYEKAEKFRRDQAAQLEYAEKKGEERGREKEPMEWPRLLSCSNG